MAVDKKELSDSLEGKDEEHKPNLEEIATKLANMQEDMKMNQLLPTVMDAFVNFPGVKYKDARGVEHYKTKFTAAETNKIAETLFDKLAYHFVLRRYGDMTPDLFEQFKKMKDAHGNSLLESELMRHAGVTLGELKKELLENRDDLTPNLLVGMVDEMLKKHTQELTKNIYSEFSNEHRDYLADFVTKKANEKGLKGREYKITKSDGLEAVFGKYVRIASQFYKKDADYKPKEEKKKSV